MDSILATCDEKPKIKPLSDFCSEVITQHRDKWPPSESTLAYEFVEGYSLQILLGLEQISRFSATLGIETSAAFLPERVRGFNFTFVDKKVILLPEKETFPGSREHTFFHELREIMEHIFSDLGFPTAQNSSMEDNAEEFAVHVRAAVFVVICSSFFENATSIQTPWKRWLAYGGIAVLGVTLCFGCALFPFLEDHLARHKE